MKFYHVLAPLALVVFGAPAHAQGWSPQRNVEIVVGSAPGGSNDKTARAVERALVDKKLVPTSITVVNRPGGGSIFTVRLPPSRVRREWLAVNFFHAMVGRP